MKFAAVLPAGGLGTRMGLDKPKQLLELAGETLLVRAVGAFVRHPKVDHVIVACPQDWLSYFEEQLKPFGVQIVVGGAERWQSVRNAVEALSADFEGLLIHDVARPLVSQQIISNCIDCLKEKRACLVAKPVVDTVQVVRNNQVVSTLDRNEIWLAQTPQCFCREDLLKAYENMPTGYHPTDEAGLMRSMGHEVCVVKGEERNNKLTHPEDVKQFEKWLEEDE